MRKCHVRLMLAGVMFASLFLPWWPGEGIHLFSSGWFLVFSGTLESLVIIVRRPDSVNLANHFHFLAFLWSAPFLVALNICLAIWSPRSLKILYRVSLLITILLVLSWIYPVSASAMGWGWGMWVNVGVISAAILIEIVFTISERLKKTQNVDLVVG